MIRKNTSFGNNENGRHEHSWGLTEITQAQAFATHYYRQKHIISWEIKITLALSHILSLEGSQPEFDLSHVVGELAKGHLFLAVVYLNLIEVDKRSQNNSLFGKSQLFPNATPGTCAEIHKCVRFRIDNFTLLVDKSLRSKLFRVVVNRFFVMSRYRLDVHQGSLLNGETDSINCKSMIFNGLSWKYTVSCTVYSSIFRQNSLQKSAVLKGIVTQIIKRLNITLDFGFELISDGWIFENMVDGHLSCMRGCIGACHKKSGEIVN